MQGQGPFKTVVWATGRPPTTHLSTVGIYSYNNLIPK